MQRINEKQSNLYETLADRNVSKLRNRDETKYETSQTKHNFNDKHKSNWKNKIEKIEKIYMHSKISC